MYIKLVVERRSIHPTKRDYLFYHGDIVGTTHHSRERMDMMMRREKSNNLLVPLILLIVTLFVSRKWIINLSIVLVARSLTLSPHLVGTRGWIDAEADTVIRVGADLDPCGPFGNANCLWRCLRPGNCNKCCKNQGFHHGECRLLACFCCKQWIECTICTNQLLPEMAGPHIFISQGAQ